MFDAQNASSSNMAVLPKATDLVLGLGSRPATRGYVYYTCNRRALEPGRTMQKKLTITIDESVYQGLYQRIGAGKISRFIEQLVRPHVLQKELEDAYAAMAKDEDRETEALEWSETLIGDALDDSR